MVSMRSFLVALAVCSTGSCIRPLFFIGDQAEELEAKPERKVGQFKDHETYKTVTSVHRDASITWVELENPLWLFRNRPHSLKPGRRVPKPLLVPRGDDGLDDERQLYPRLRIATLQATNTFSIEVLEHHAESDYTGKPLSLGVIIKKTWTECWGLDMALLRTVHFGHAMILADKTTMADIQSTRALLGLRPNLPFQLTSPDFEHPSKYAHEVPDYPEPTDPSATSQHYHIWFQMARGKMFTAASEAADLAVKMIENITVYPWPPVPGGAGATDSIFYDLAARPPSERPPSISAA